jgi:hypothetical protein
MEKGAKLKVTTAVAQYIKAYPDEYKAFADWSAKVRSEQKDKFARTPKGTDAIERKLGEIPEVLYAMIIRALSADEQSWFFARDSYTGDFRGPYWFYKKYPVFSVTVV